MLLLDLSHTSHTRARTGIQRVTRALHRAFVQEAAAICYDPYARQWRQLESWERENLVSSDGADGKRGARWPLAARLRGRLRRWTSNSSISQALATLQPTGLIVPEIFSPAVARALPEIFSLTSGPRVALFHDAIALKFPELTPAKTVARFPAYLQELLAFDGIAAVSDDSRESLLDYWRWLGVSHAPSIVTLPLGLDPKCHLSDDIPAIGAEPVVLSIGSIEGRKNHVALLEACEQLWASGARFSLRLIGLAHPQTGRPALERLRALQAAGRPLRYDGPVDDRILEAAYAACTFTVYPSLIEGFGLPVIESLVRSRPCICSARGALGESARGGGCVVLDTMDAASLAEAIRRLLTNQGERERLIAEARNRSFKTWDTYARELIGWAQTLKRRN